MKNTFVFLISVGIGFILSFVPATKIFSQTLPPVDPTTLTLAYSATTTTVGESMTIGVGITNPSKPVSGIDAVMRFDSEYFEVVTIASGASELTTIVPLGTNGADITRAVTIYPSDSSLSTIDFGLLSFNSSSNQPGSALTTTYDALTNPLAVITVKAKKIGSAQFNFVYKGPSETTDSNIVTIDNGVISDLMTAPDTGSSILILPSNSTTPTLTPIPPTVSPSPTPLPSNICSLYDFDHDLKITVADIMRVAARWNQKLGDTNFSGIYDLNSDGAITIIDIQLIASKWGVLCESN